MKLWIDDMRPAPEISDWIWCRSVNEAKRLICVLHDKLFIDIDVIDIDYDMSEYAYDGDDNIRLLDWLEENGYSYPIYIHSRNSVGAQNIRTIIPKNRLEEVQ